MVNTTGGLHGRYAVLAVKVLPNVPCVPTQEPDANKAQVELDSTNPRTCGFREGLRPPSDKLHREP